ncbi:histidine triad (HIT) protein [Kineococcus indalonis]|uniref:histidine triad (HIT) protein n=1 Tax=Kineococcus indalonis TaxID=2696566 RepID=UPI00141250F5|nr:histidine triad (HIT) protein [Kineococcus indalonis]NAZ86981.1 histidine triad (HIT) protein [Kineococcus indalonis]
MTAAEGCPICAKHCGAGPLVSPVLWSDDLVVVTHAPAREAGALAEAAWTAARVLAERFATEHVFSAIAGLGVAHVHQHVFARSPSTPQAVPWHGSATWPGAATVSPGELEVLVRDLTSRWERLRRG